MQIAQSLKEQGMLAPALAAVAEAEKLTPADSIVARAVALLRGDLHAALGEPAAAQTAWMQAAALSLSPGQLAEVDQKLFRLLSQPAKAGNAGTGGKIQFVLPRPPGDAASLTPALETFLATLAAEAERTPDERAGLRLAQWQLWAHKSKAAREAAERVLSFAPDSIAAHDFLARLAAGDALAPVAARHLARLAELDPAHRFDYARRSAQLDLQAGRTDAALENLTALAREKPGDLEVLHDLAEAQTRAERWPEALSTWRDLYARSPAPQRKEALAPVLRAFDRLGEPQPAAELLLHEIGTRGDAKEQLDLFKELLAHCTRHGLLPWLRTEWEKRRDGLGDDAPTEIAYSRVLRALGEKAAAFEVLRVASFAVPNPAEVLPELVREAEALRRFDAAIELQERLARLSPPDHSEALEHLADLQEKNGALVAAERTWGRLTARFPRDAAMLGRAADFLLRSGDPARAADALRKACALEPAHAPALWALAQLNLTSADPCAAVEAERCLEQILAVTPPESAGESIRFPALKPEDAGRLQAAYLAAVRERRGHADPGTMRALRGFWVELPAEGKGERDVRLPAIRELARLVREKDDPTLLAAWVARWQAQANSAPSEALWAWFYAGCGAETLGLSEELVVREPGNVQRQQAFIWLALQSHEYARLGAWMCDRRRTPAERDFVLIALGQDLAAGKGRVDPELLDGVFPPGTRLRAWQAATLFGRRGFFREALQLGGQALDRAGAARAGMRVEMAAWHLCLGEPDEALRTLRDTCAEPAESFDSPVFTALRQAFLLTPAPERAAFAERVERAVAEPGVPPIHAALTRTLFRSLAGKEGSARVALRELLALQPMAPLGEESEDAAARRWGFILSTGMHLQTWRLDAQAAALWKEALADSALVRLQGEGAGELAREVRKRFFALRLARAAPEEIDALLIEFRGGATSADGTLALGEALETLGALGRAIDLYRRVWEREPAQGPALRSLLTACRAANDTGTAESVLRVCVRDQLFAANETVQRDLTMQLADLLEQRGDRDGAAAVLAGADRIAPNDSRLLTALAQLHERAGRPLDAEAAWRRVLALEPAQIAARIALSALLEKAGKVPDAISAFAAAGGEQIDARLAELLLGNGRTDEALDALERIPVPAHVATAQSLATTLAERGERPLARRVLHDAAARAGTDFAVAMRAQSQLIEMLSPAEDTALIPRELRKLRRMAGDDPARLGSYFTFLQLHARALGVEEAADAELRAAWSGGSGALPAGAVLLAWHLDRGAAAEAEETLDRLLSRTDAGDAWLSALVPGLATAGRSDLIARVQARLVEINPLDDERIVALARTLAGCGRRDEAFAALDRWGARARMDDEFAGVLAQTFVSLGAPARGEPLFAQAVRGDPFARNYRVYLDFAQLRVAQGNFRAARELLLAAFRHPGNREYDVLIAWLAAAGALNDWQRVLAEFRFSAAQMADVERARAEHLARLSRRAES